MTQQKEKGKYDDFIVAIHNRPYMTVAGRIKEFWDIAKELKGSGLQEPKASIKTVVEYAGNEIKVEAIATLGDMFATGHASEVIGDSPINKDSALENCETSAVGRALGNLGIGLLSAGGIASADEVRSAERKAENRTMGTRPASDKQKELIRKLVAEKGKDMPTDDWFAKLDMATAKASIEKLLTYMSVSPAGMPDDTISYDEEQHDNIIEKDQ